MNKNTRDMIDDILNEVKYTRSMIGRDHFATRVMDVMARVPREEFVPADLKNSAFDNGPLPIGNGQTISQPYIVALMTDLLDLEENHTVLEIGTGSGYQTAILSLLCKQVYTVEVVADLAKAAISRLKNLHYDNVEFRTGNGYEGWPEHAPYEGIIVTAAAANIPEALVKQLKPGCKLVIPVGLPYMPQELMLVEKTPEGGIQSRDILSVAFVPLVKHPVPDN